MKTTTIALKSIGCRTNQEEMASLRYRLKSEGYSLVEGNDDADVMIVNTCSVTAHTEAKTKRFIHSLAKKSPKAKIMVTGCLAQQIPEELLKTRGVSWVVGNAFKKDIPGILSSKEEGLHYSLLTSRNTPVAVFNNHPLIPNDEGRTRFPVKIQEGCNYHCSYCIVPSLRGPSRSVRKLDVLKICRESIEAGYKEIVLTGTHIGQYTFGKKYKLIELMDDILAIGKDFRLRLSSLDPRDCSDELLERIEDEKRLCMHVHVNVQSFSPEILKGMHREYKDYDSLIMRLDSFSRRCSSAGIGGDFIVGFPGETGSMFETTLKTVEQIGFNYGHVFRYSKRPGTAASVMDRQVSEKEKTVRSNALRECLAKMRVQFIEKQFFRVIHTIIVEQEKPVRGITSNYIRVEIPKVFSMRNSWQKVILSKYLPDKNCCQAMVSGES